jgi:hypothetical protein
VLGVQKLYVNFLETDFATHNSFTVFRHSATNSGLRCKNRFRFQGNATEVNRMRPSMCNVLRRDEAEPIAVGAVNGLIVPQSSCYLVINS